MQKLIVSSQLICRPEKRNRTSHVNIEFKYQLSAESRQIFSVIRFQLKSHSGWCSASQWRILVLWPTSEMDKTPIKTYCKGHPINSNDSSATIHVNSNLRALATGKTWYDETVPFLCLVRWTSRGKTSTYIWHIPIYKSNFVDCSHNVIIFALKTENITQINNKGHFYGVLSPFLEIDCCI